ncbi:M24 family metallopeptidase [Aliidiomarina sp. B3213]|uniref:M24 family metallopeptidase n=1 Tax=Aliidiomarina sp. B3213 TaxID=2249757 RepID=UPI000DCF7AA8|nr:M24 family metallopeptidase [Aliidiomarina sp. B3213]RTE85819.1 M24 family metallopeptidase [Aliidiomarina sp. B3213]TCZ90180.1 M24 family metallopeptidase [Lysobacter sp. N42]
MRIGFAVGALLAAIGIFVFWPSVANEPSQGRVLKSAEHYQVLPQQARIEPVNAMLTDRLENLLPALMEEQNIDMWLVLNREYAEDPVYFTLVPQPTFAARRTTMLVFNRLEDGTVERLTVNTYPFGAPYEAAWSGGNLDEQWQALGDLIVEKDPSSIGINVSRDWPVADGLSSALHQRLTEVLPDTFQDRLVSAEKLVVRWVETRTEQELEIYPHVLSLARAVIGEAFSSQVITPGVTHTDDVAWYIRNRFEELQLPIWFMPYVSYQRVGTECEEDTFFCGSEGVIQRGDVLHTDVGICYLTLCTDTQEMAYVLEVGERDIPQGFKDALLTGNRWQDILTDNFVTGRTGNEILAATIAQNESEGIISSTYTHPLGFYGHAPGPTIGMWDNQGPTPIRGDYPLYPNTAYAIEGNVKQAVPEWNGQFVHIRLEQSAYFNGENVIYFAGRQTQWHLIE